MGVKTVKRSLTKIPPIFFFLLILTFFATIFTYNSTTPVLQNPQLSLPEIQPFPTRTGVTPYPTERMTQTLTESATGVVTPTLTGSAPGVDKRASLGPRAR